VWIGRGSGLIPFAPASRPCRGPVARAATPPGQGGHGSSRRGGSRGYFSLKYQAPPTRAPEISQLAPQGVDCRAGREVAPGPGSATTASSGHCCRR
jgi:hypothetical protein